MMVRLCRNRGLCSVKYPLLAVPSISEYHKYYLDGCKLEIVVQSIWIVNAPVF